MIDGCAMVVFLITWTSIRFLIFFRRSLCKTICLVVGRSCFLFLSSLTGTGHAFLTRKQTYFS